MSKEHTEYVTVRDYGKQGLAVFDLTYPANLGNIMCWGTLMSYDNEPRDFRPDLDAPMAFSEADLGYYWQGKPVKRDDPRVAPLLKRYSRFVLNSNPELDRVILMLKMRDSQKFRDQRWKR